MSESPSRLRRTLIEAVVIVGSILLAFAIDAGWDARGDRAEARALLLDLEAEFQESLSILGWVIDVREGRARQAERLLEGIAAFPDDASLNSALNQVFLGYTTVNLPTGAHTTYLGRASAIEGQALRTLLASWSGTLEENAEDESVEVSLVIDQLTPFLAQRIDLGPVFAAHPAQIFGEFPERGDPNRVGPAELLADPDFRNLVRVRLARTRILIREARGLQAEAEQILALIRDQLVA